MARLGIEQRFFRGLAEAGRSRIGKGEYEEWLASYRERPAAFARKVLGSRWWSAQETVARAVVKHRRVAVRSGNGVGKSYLAADLALWFLYCQRPAVVVTTAPTARQVEDVIWREIRRRHQGARRPLPGRLMMKKLKVGDLGRRRDVRQNTRTGSKADPSYLGMTAGGKSCDSFAAGMTAGGKSCESFAIGLTANKADCFQGFHGENLLIIMEEASGIADEIWAGAEGIAVADNNRILAIGNPLRVSGRFYDVFRGEGWHKVRISALDHPNVTGRGPTIPGCVTPGWIDEKVLEWCEEVEGIGSRVSGVGSADGGDDGRLPIDDGRCKPDVVRWRRKLYRAGDMFQARVLGDFPDADGRALIPMRWVEAAMERELPEGDYRRAAVDVARYGEDDTVIGVRAGPVVIWLEEIHGMDTVAVARMVSRAAYQFHPSTIAVDAVGGGVGVVDQLYSDRIEGVEAVNVAKPAYNSEIYANRRAELYWGLRERFRTGEIALKRHEKLAAELAALQYRINERGQIQIEKKEELKRRIRRSPDRADMLALLFDGAGESVVRWTPAVLPPSQVAILREEMRVW